MSFSRDVGLVSSEEVEKACDRATTHARGILRDEDKEKLAQLHRTAGRGEPLSQDDRNTLKHLNMVSDGPQHGPEELEAMTNAIKLAVAGVDIVGGKANVYFAGGVREVEDPTTGRGLRRIQTSITVTITVTHGQGEAPAVVAPHVDTRPKEHGPNLHDK